MPLLHTASARHVTVIGVHLKAGATSEDRAARRQQAAQLRRRLQDPAAPPALPRALQHVGIDVAGEDASRDCARKVSVSTARRAAATVVLGDFNDLPTSAPLTTLMPENEKCACGRGSGGGLRVAGLDGDANGRKAVPRVAPQCGCTNCAAAPLRSCWDDYAGLLAAASAEGTAASDGCDVPLGEWLEGGGGGDGGACTDAIGDVFTTWKFRRRRGGGGDEEKQAVIDHVLYGAHSLRLGAMRRMPDARELGECALPSREFPSDHLPVVARLVWT